MDSVDKIDYWQAGWIDVKSNRIFWKVSKLNANKSSKKWSMIKSFGNFQKTSLKVD